MRSGNDRYGQNGDEVIGDGIFPPTIRVDCPADQNREDEAEPAGEVPRTLEGRDEPEAFLGTDGLPYSISRNGKGRSR